MAFSLSMQKHTSFHEVLAHCQDLMATSYDKVEFPRHAEKAYNRTQPL